MFGLFQLSEAHVARLAFFSKPKASLALMIRAGRGGLSPSIAMGCISWMPPKAYGTYKTLYNHRKRRIDRAVFAPG